LLKNEGKIQDFYMENEDCILVDEYDTIVGSASKRKVHVFNAEQVILRVSSIDFKYIFFSAAKRLASQSFFNFPLQ